MIKTTPDEQPKLEMRDLIFRGKHWLTAEQLGSRFHPAERSESVLAQLEIDRRIGAVVGIGITHYARRRFIENDEPFPIVHEVLEIFRGMIFFPMGGFPISTDQSTRPVERTRSPVEISSFTLRKLWKHVCSATDLPSALPKPL